MIKRKQLKIGLIALLAAGLLAGLWMLSFFMGWLPEKGYSAADFGLETAVSTVDFNQNGTDDYADLLAARKKTRKTIRAITAHIIRAATRPRRSAFAPIWSGGRFGRPAIP